MNRFVDKLHKNINLFINNYLIDGALAEVHGFSDIDYVFYEKYPYLCIAYLLNANSLLDVYNKFIEDHKDEIKLEISTLEKLMGAFLQFSSICMDKDKQIQELKKANDDSWSCYTQLSEEIKGLNEKLKEKENVIKDLTSRLSHCDLDQPKHEDEPLLLNSPQSDMSTVGKKFASAMREATRKLHETHPWPWMFSGTSSCDIEKIFHDNCSSEDSFVDLGNGIIWARKNFGAKVEEDTGITYSSPAHNPDKIEINHIIQRINKDYYKSGGYELEIPTFDDCRKLLNACQWSEFEYMGVKGMRGISKSNGRTIFFPFNHNIKNCNAVCIWTRAIENHLGPNAGKGRALELLDAEHHIAYYPLTQLFPIRLVLKPNRKRY